MVFEHFTFCVRDQDDRTEAASHSSRRSIYTDYLKEVGKYLKCYSLDDYITFQALQNAVKHKHWFYAILRDAALFAYLTIGSLLFPCILWR